MSLFVNYVFLNFLHSSFGNQFVIAGLSVYLGIRTYLPTVGKCSGVSYEFLDILIDTVWQYRMKCSPDGVHRLASVFRCSAFYSTSHILIKRKIFFDILDLWLLVYMEGKHIGII